MTWGVITFIVLVSLLKLAMTCLPTPVVNRLVKTFQTHPQLSLNNTDVMINGTLIENEQKTKLIEAFNNSTYLNSIYVHPGNIDVLLQRSETESSILFTSRIGKQECTFRLFPDDKGIDVVKTVKKKVIAYRILSDELQSMQL